MGSVDSLAADFWMRSQVTPGGLTIPLGTVPQMHGYWLGSALDNVQNWPDQTMSGLDLTVGGSVTQGIATEWPGTLAPYIEFDGTRDYYWRNDEPALSITGDLTITAWVWFDVVNRQQGIVNKWEETLGNNRSYCLDLTSSGELRFRVSEDGSAVNMATATTAPLSAGQWYFAQGRLMAGVVTGVRVNNEAWVNDTTNVLYGIHDSTRALYVGMDHESTIMRLDGRIQQWMLAGYPTPTAVLNYIYAVQAPYFGRN